MAKKDVDHNQRIALVIENKPCYNLSNFHKIGKTELQEPKKQEEKV